MASAARRECVTEDFGHHNDSRVQTGFGERGGAGERSEHHRVRHHQRQVVVPVEMTGTSTAVVIAPMRAATLAFRFGARTTSGNNRSVFSRKRHFLNRLGLTLVLSPHNPPTQLPQRNPTPPSPLLLSCIRILLPGGDRTVPSRGRVGGRLGRRRPSLRLTRIHLPRPPLRGSAPHQPALPNTPHRRRHTLSTTHRRLGSAPQIRRALQTRLPYLRRQLFGTRLRGRTGLQFGQTIPRCSMQRDRNVIHDQIKRHPLRRLHTHKHRSEQQRTHPPRSSQLQPRHLDLRPPLNLGKLPPIHRRQTQNAGNIALTNTPLPYEWVLVIRKISRPVIQNLTTNRIIRRPSPHLTQTHRILSTARTLTPRQRRPRPPE